MKKSILIIALSLALGIGNAHADHRPGNNGNKTEQRDHRSSDKGHRKNKDHDSKKEKHQQDKYYKWNKHSTHPNRSHGTPAHSYRPIPTPPPGHSYRYGVNPALAYVIGAANVIFNGVVVPGVNMPTFQVLDYGYARDRHHVYYNGKVLKKADPSTFRVLNDGYARDAWRVWYFGKRVK